MKQYFLMCHFFSLSNKNITGSIPIPGFKLNCRTISNKNQYVTSIKTDVLINEIQVNDPDILSYNSSYLIFDNDAKIFIGKKASIFNQWF